MALSILNRTVFFFDIDNCVSNPNVYELVGINIW